MEVRSKLRRISTTEGLQLGKHNKNIYTKEGNTVSREQCVTSVEVAIFLSLIFSYFCFLFPALRPCHGRLTVGKQCVNPDISENQR
jgi:hypothetical protein